MRYEDFDPQWRCAPGRDTYHLDGRESGRMGYQPDLKTLCGRRASKFTLGGYDPESKVDVACKTCEKRAEKIRPLLIGMANVARASENTFAGHCPGAYHWTGEIKLGRDHARELSFRLTYLQARKLNAEQPDYGRWEAGEPSTRFFTREALRKRAVEVVKEVWPEAVGLMIGGGWIGLGPDEVIWLPGRPKVLVELNGIHAAREALYEGRRRLDEEGEAQDDRLCKQWRQIMRREGLYLEPEGDY